MHKQIAGLKDRWTHWYCMMETTFVVANFFQEFTKNTEVGNAECLRSAVHWKEFLDMLQERGSVGDKFPQICPRHPDIQNFAREADDVGILERHEMLCPIGS